MKEVHTIMEATRTTQGLSQDFHLGGAQSEGEVEIVLAKPHMASSLLAIGVGLGWGCAPSTKAFDTFYVTAIKSINNTYG